VYCAPLREPHFDAQSNNKTTYHHTTLINFQLQS
jgi:hypothetical protein